MAISEPPCAADDNPSFGEFSFATLPPLKPMALRAADSVLWETTGGALEDSYELGSVLGSGHFGVVRACRHLATGEAFACKTVEKKRLRREFQRRELRREVETMRRLGSHPNVVRLHAVFEDATSVHLVQELCAGGELFEAITAKRFYSEGEAARVFRDVLRAVSHCHWKGVMHRDLKPENLLLATMMQAGAPHPSVKLCDFGLALHLADGEQSEGLAGSPFYMAPEVIVGQYGREADVWSLGVVLFILLCGAPPFWGDSERKTFQAVVHGQLSFSEAPWRHVSLEAKCLVRRILSLDPTRRPTVAELLNHPWLQQHAPQAAPETVTRPQVKVTTPSAALRSADADEAAELAPMPAPLRGDAAGLGSSRSSARSSSWNLSPRGPLDPTSHCAEFWWPQSPEKAL